MSKNNELKFDYARYLAAKESIDERFLNNTVWTAFIQSLQQHNRQTLRVIEAGGGIGATFKRMVKADFSQDIDYTLLDVEAENLAYFEQHQGKWLNTLGYKEQDGHASVWRNDDGRKIEITLTHGDILETVKNQDCWGRWDVIIAQAFLDLFDLETFLPAFLRLLDQDGLFYFPINFDGITSFLPTLEPSVDQLVEAIYHQSMDARAILPAHKGRSQSGRFLITELTKLDVRITSIGSSDWIVFPIDGAYADEDQYFLKQILNFVEGELKKSNKIDSKLARKWVVERINQLERCELIYLAHQIDLLGERVG